MKLEKKLFFIILSLVLVSGCGVRKPAGIPELHPAKVTVTNAGTPIKDATVTLRPVDSANSGNWNTLAITDENGVATIATSQGEWKSIGVPAGEYKVVVVKKPDYAPLPMPEDIEGDEQAKQAYYAEEKKKRDAATSEVPASLGGATTPLRLTVAAGTPAEFTVDVAEHK